MGILPAGQLNFHKLIKMIYDFERIKYEKITAYLNFVERPRKIRYATLRAHERITVMCRNFAAFDLDQKKNSIVNFCIILGTVRDLTGNWNEQNSFNIPGVLDDSFPEAFL